MGQLLASINSVEVGVLRDEGGVWSFEYAASWATSPDSFDVAPSLARSKGKIIDGATRRPVQWFFDNLLPEDAAREVLAREARLSSADAFGLLTYYGRESAGAITLLPPGEAQAESGYQPLTDEELHERIARLPRYALSSGAPKRMSLAGGQHKLAVAVHDGKLFHPVGRTPSTHILKPDHKETDHYPNSAANEYFVMRLAQKMDLSVPQVELRFVPDPIYLIERFDRQIAGPETSRLHAIDACQLLGLDRSFKYQQADSQALRQCIDLCQNRAQARQSILEWSLFNCLVGNGDAHLKNLSFIVRPSGIELASFYDVLSTECYRAEAGNQPRWPAIKLAIQIGHAQEFGAVTRADFVQFAEQLGSAERVAVRVLDEYCGKLETVAEGLYQELEALAYPQPEMRAAILRTLRSIRFAVIGDMVRRLRPRPAANLSPSPRP